MKRTLVTLGIIALAIGLTTMLETGIFSKDVITYTTPWQNSDKWEISGNFTAGNMLNFTIVPGADWGLMANRKDPVDNSHSIRSPLMSRLLTRMAERPILRMFSLKPTKRV